MKLLREKIKIVIFGTNTPAGKLFDLILIISILISVSFVMLDSITELNEKYGTIFLKFLNSFLHCFYPRIFFENVKCSKTRYLYF